MHVLASGTWESACLGVGRNMFTFSTHGNGVRDTNGIVLPAEHSLLLYCILDSLGKIEH
jgi:hypothetical protein